MVDNPRPWWRDRRFVIASIVVPVIVAAFGLWPHIAPEKVSDSLLVTLSIRDPRRSEPGGLEKRLERTFDLSRYQSESAAARGIARSMIEELRSNEDIFPAQREALDVRLHRKEDGRIVIAEPQKAHLSLAVSRFIEARDLNDLIRRSEAPPSPIQMPLSEPVLPLSESVLDSKLRAGVYRITVMGPGYKTDSTYLQLTEDGELSTVSRSGAIEALRFPLDVKLKPKSSGPLRIAIQRCQVSVGATSKPRYKNINQAVQSDLEKELRLLGFKAIVVHEGERVALDLAPSKGMPPTVGVISADFVIENCKCEWLE